MAKPKFTYYIGGTADENNYSRGSDNPYGSRITQFNFEQKEINELPRLKLVVAAFDTSDTNLAEGVYVYQFCGESHDATDTIIAKYLIVNTIPKSDGYMEIQCVASAGESASRQLTELSADATESGGGQKTLGTTSQIIAGFINTGEGTKDIDAVDVTGATSRLSSFKIPPGVYSKFGALKKYTRDQGYEFKIGYSTP